jgi:hypothetical protein
MSLRLAKYDHSTGRIIEDHADPTDPGHLTTKDYVDKEIANLPIVENDGPLPVDNDVAVFDGVSGKKIKTIGLHESELFLTSGTRPMTSSIDLANNDVLRVGALNGFSGTAINMNQTDKIRLYAGAGAQRVSVDEVQMACDNVNLNMNDNNIVMGPLGLVDGVNVSELATAVGNKVDKVSPSQLHNVPMFLNTSGDLRNLDNFMVFDEGQYITTITSELNPGGDSFNLGSATAYRWYTMHSEIIDTRVISGGYEIDTVPDVIQVGSNLAFGPSRALYGSTAAGGNLDLYSTTDASKGEVRVNDNLKMYNASFDVNGNDFILQAAQMEIYTTAESTTIISNIDEWVPVVFDIGQVVVRPDTLGFDVDLVTNYGRFTYNPPAPLDRSRLVHMATTISCSVATGTNIQVAFAFFKTSGPSDVMIPGSEIFLFMGNNVAEVQSSAIHSFPKLAVGDEIALFCKNVTSTDNIVMVANNIFAMALPNVV